VRSVQETQWVSPSAAKHERVIFDGRVGRVLHYFGGPSPFPGPQAYLVTQRGYTLRPHFHPSDQFQVLFGAPGSVFGRRPIGDVVVHYADAFTPYGPLIGGDPPLRYFTLRRLPTGVTAHMPESRAAMVGRPGRSLHRDVPLSSGAGTGPDAHGARRVTLLEDPADGLRAETVHAGAGEVVQVRDTGPGGQFLVPVAGSVETPTESYPVESVGWRPPGRPAGRVTGGDGGLVLLVLTFPAASGNERMRSAETGDRQPPGSSFQKPLA
jgi:hypothetical protein